MNNNFLHIKLQQLIKEFMVGVRSMKAKIETLVFESTSAPSSTINGQLWIDSTDMKYKSGSTVYTLMTNLNVYAVIGTMVVGNTETGITVTYDNITHKLNFATDVLSVNGKIGVIVLTTDDITEGSTKLYYTDTRARAAISETVTGLDYNNITGVISLTTGYVIPTTTEETNWNTAYGWGNHASGGYFIKASDDLDDITTGSTNVHLTTTLKTNYDSAYSHISSTSNPHSVTKTQVSLGNVDNVQQMPASYLDTDGTLAANSDSKVPSQKAVKTYAVTGPGSSVSGNIATFNGTGARTLQDSGIASSSLVLTSTNQTIAGNKTFSGAAYIANLNNPFKLLEIGTIKDIVGANLVLALIFDETGATTTIRDRSGNGYNATLSANASSMSPLVQGYKNSLLFSRTSDYYWEVDDNDAFSFVSGGVDTAFSIFAVITPTAYTSGEIFAKGNYPGNEEYILQFESVTGKFRLLKYDSAHSTAQIYRYNNTLLSLNTIYSVGGSAAAGATATDIHCYLNGVLDDGSSGSSGAYTCMVNGTAKPGNTLTWSGTRYPFIGRQSTIIVANSVLTANQFKDLDEICRGLTG